LVEASVWEPGSFRDFLDYGKSQGLSPRCQELKKERTESLFRRNDHRHDELQRMFTAAVAKNRGSLHGELWILLFVNPQGRCERVYILRNEIHNLEFAKALAMHLSTIRYQADEACDTQDILYPIHFRDDAFELPDQSKM